MNYEEFLCNTSIIGYTKTHLYWSEMNETR